MMIFYPDQSPHETPTAPMLRVPGSAPPDDLEDRPTIPYLFPPGPNEEPIPDAADLSWGPTGA